MRLKFFLLLIYLTFLKLTFASVRIIEKGEIITVENDILRFTIDLKNGARISEYFYKPFDENIVYPISSAGGMLMDHVWEQIWPGEFLNRKYEYRIIKNTPEEASISVWTIGNEETTKGLKFERIITLKENDRFIHCRVLVSNPTNEGRIIGYWNQNNFWFGGKKEGMEWARPSTTGVDRMGIDENGNSWFSKRWYYVDDPISGWNGTYNKKLQKGLMFLMDYNDLWRIYDNAAAVTTEWMYDRVAIPSGKTWVTDIYIIPVYGIDGFEYGSLNFICNLSTNEIPGGVEIELQFTKSVNDIDDVKAKVRLYGLKEKWEIKSSVINFGKLDEKVKKEKIIIKDVGNMPCGIEVILSGKTKEGKEIEEKFGEFFGGKEGKNLDMITMQPYLKFERPKKKKVFLKPDILKYVPNEKPKVLFLRGMWSEFFKIEEAIKKVFPEAKIDNGYLDTSTVGLSFSYFPVDYDSLLSYDIIILGNVPAEPIGLIGEEMIKDYVIAGGNLIILGGDQSFGQADFSNEEFLNILPVEVGGKYNWNKIKEEGILKIASSHPIVNGIKFSSNTYVYYSHICKPKQNSNVILKAGDRPIFVISEEKNKGKIVCILATPFGEGKKGEVPFWESNEWQNIMENMVKYLLKNN